MKGQDYQAHYPSASSGQRKGLGDLMLWKSLHGHKSDQPQRVGTLRALAIIYSALWAVIAVLESPWSLTALVSVILLTLTFWFVIAVSSRGGERVFARLLFTGWAITAGWVLLTGPLSQFEMSPWLQVPLGVALTAIYYAILLNQPIWLINLEAGEVYFRRLGENQGTSYSLITCALNLDKSTPTTLHPGPTVHGHGSTVVTVTMGADYHWIKPIDEFRLIWRLDKTIWVNELAVEDIVTRDRSTFDLKITAAFEHDPCKLRADGLLLNLPNFRQPADLEAALRGAVSGALDRVAREFFVTRSVIDARTSGAIVDFKAGLPDLLGGLCQVLGLKLNVALTNITPAVTDQQRHAAGLYAAANDQGESDFARLDAAGRRMTLPMSDEQLFYYVISQHTRPESDQTPYLTEEDRILRYLQAGGVEALRDLEAVLAEHPEMPVPPRIQLLMKRLQRQHNRWVPPSVGAGPVGLGNGASSPAAASSGAQPADAHNASGDQGNGRRNNRQHENESTAAQTPPPPPKRTINLGQVIEMRKSSDNTYRPVDE
ncbi:MAG: hypothetical protein GYB67_00720 [Chloroflexi bacterium]|nr:hypothetical protein [Chloroflexota bacterium]